MIGKKNILIGFIIICLIISPIITPSFATDWPMFQLNTKHTGYMDETSDFNPDTWIIQTGGILTSPVISDKIIYFGSSNGLFSAHNIEKGTKVWDYKVEANITASPVIVGDYVYFGSGDNYLYALNKKTGDDIWKYKTGNSISTTPAIDNGIIYFGSDDQRLYALNTNDSSMKWEFQTGNAIKSSPTIFNNIIYFGSDDGKIYAVNINGEKVWEYNTGSVVRSSAAINNITLYMGTDNGNFYALNTMDGSVLWKYDFDDSIKSSALLDSDDNSIFIDSNNGNITALDMRNGR